MPMGKKNYLSCGLSRTNKNIYSVHAVSKLAFKPISEEKVCVFVGKHWKTRPIHQKNCVKLFRISTEVISFWVSVRSETIVSFAGSSKNPTLLQYVMPQQNKTGVSFKFVLLLIKLDPAILYSLYVTENGSILTSWMFGRYSWARLEYLHSFFQHQECCWRYSVTHRRARLYLQHVWRRWVQSKSRASAWIKLMF